MDIKQSRRAIIFCSLKNKHLLHVLHNIQRIKENLCLPAWRLRFFLRCPRGTSILIQFSLGDPFIGDALPEFENSPRGSFCTAMNIHKGEIEHFKTPFPRHYKDKSRTNLFWINNRRDLQILKWLVTFRSCWVLL